MTNLINHSNDKADNMRIFAIVSYIFMFIFPIVSIILAYVKKKDSEDTIYYSHFLYLIRTFWVGFWTTIICIFLLPSLFLFNSLGFILVSIVSLVSFVVGIWYLVRVIFGLIKTIAKQEVKGKTWLI